MAGWPAAPVPHATQRSHSRHPSSHCAHLKRAVMARVASTAAPSPNLPMDVAYLQAGCEHGLGLLVAALAAGCSKAPCPNLPIDVAYLAGEEAVWTQFSAPPKGCGGETAVGLGRMVHRHAGATRCASC